MVNQPPRNNWGLAIAIVVAGLVIGAAIYASSSSFAGTATATKTVTSTTRSPSSTHNTISVSGLGLCSSNCGYPAPYASALVTFNASVPVSSLTVYVNGTYDALAFQNPDTTTVACTSAADQTCSVQLGGSGYSSGTYTTITKYYASCSVPANSTSCTATYTGSLNTLTAFAELYKGSVPSSLIPVVRGDTYVFTFVAVFQDGSAATATASTVAS